MKFLWRVPAVDADPGSLLAGGEHGCLECLVVSLPTRDGVSGNIPYLRSLEEALPRSGPLLYQELDLGPQAREASFCRGSNMMSDHVQRVEGPMQNIAEQQPEAGHLSSVIFYCWVSGLYSSFLMARARAGAKLKLPEPMLDAPLGKSWQNCDERRWFFELAKADSGASSHTQQ